MNLGILIYPQAEVLDFSGPFEVFSTAKRLGQLDWNIDLLAEDLSPVIVRGGMTVVPDYGIDDHPLLDVLVVVGGDHTQAYKNTRYLNWIREIDKTAKRVVSVCTGVFFLAEAGLLDGREVTTHWEDIADLRRDYPQLNVVDKLRWVNAHPYTTSGGIAAGIDMSLFLVAELAGRGLAQRTAKQMEYPCPEF